jgi:hypothetical protein
MLTFLLVNILACSNNPKAISVAENNTTSWVNLLENDSLDLWTNGAANNSQKLSAIGDLWSLNNGTLYLNRQNKGRGGQIVTKKSYYDFELKFDFKISYNGNSGVKYRTNKELLGIEYQIIDDINYRDNKIPSHRTASMYEIIAAPDSKTLYPAGEKWNSGRIIAKGNTLEHWLNGEKVLSIEFGSQDWQERFAKSKYKAIPDFAKSAGPILLQDHRDSVSYRNIFIREFN